MVEIQIAALQNSPVETSFQYAMEVAQAFVCLHEPCLNKIFFTAQKYSVFNYHPRTTTTQASLRIPGRTIKEENTLTEVKVQSLSPGFSEMWGTEPEGNLNDFGQTLI